MRGGVILPKLADVLSLPAAHRAARFFERPWRSEFFAEGEAADRGAIQREVMAAGNLGGGKAVGSRRSGGEQLAQSGEDLGGPGPAALAAGSARRPTVSAPRGHCGEVRRGELIKAAAAHGQFRGPVGGGKFASAKAPQDITDKGRGETGAKLLVVFSFAKPARKSARAQPAARLRYAPAGGGLRLSSFDRTLVQV